MERAVWHSALHSPPLCWPAHTNPQRNISCEQEAMAPKWERHLGSTHIWISRVHSSPLAGLLCSLCTRAVIPIKTFGVCKGLSVRSMNHAKSCLLVRGWPAELHQGSEGALLCSLWFEMLIREVSNSELAEADRRTEDVGAGCSSPLFHYPMKTGRNESLRRGTWRVKGKPDLSELLQPG